MNNITVGGRFENVKINSFFIGNVGQISYANLRKKDMIDETYSISLGAWKTDSKIDVDIVLPKYRDPVYIGENVAADKTIADIFEKQSRTIYNWDQVGNNSWKRAEKVEKLIYIPGKYYEVVYPNKENRDYPHTVYVFCCYAEFEGSKIHIYDLTNMPNGNSGFFSDDKFKLYKYIEPSPAITSPGIGVTAPPIAIFETAEETTLQLKSGIPSDEYTVDIYKINDKGTPEEYIQDGNKVDDPKKIPLKQEGAIFLLKYNVEQFEVPNITKTIKILTNDESKNKDTLLTKYSEIRYPYQYTAEKHQSLNDAINSIKDKFEAGNDENKWLKKFNKTYKQKDSNLDEITITSTGKGASYDKKLFVVNLDKDTYNEIVYLKNKIDFIYNTIKLKTDYKYDSVKWLRFITKYINYNSYFIEQQESVVVQRQKLLNGFKKFGVTDKQKQELYCFDLYDKDFHKLLYLNNEIKYNDISNKLLKFLNLKEFIKLKKVTPSKLSDIINLDKYVRFKIKSKSV